MVFRKIFARLIKTASVFSISLLVLGACAPASLNPTADAALLSTQAAATVLSELTLTAQPGATATASPAPTATATLTPAPTETPTATPSPTPLAQFDAFEVVSIENLLVGGVRITVKLPGIGAPLTLTLEGRTYACKTDPATPDRLFCNGLTMPPLNQSIPAALSLPESDQPVWTGSVVLRNNLVIFPVRRTYFARPECSEPGKNLGCETECRINTNGSPCVVSTCFDVCGPYFSVHTCDPNMNKPFTMCAPDVTEQMKILYGVP